MNEKQPGQTEEKLAKSLTAESTDLLPHLPYLLQDLWELGTDPDIVIDFIRKHMPAPHSIKVLDFGCGKGAVGVRLAKVLGCRVTGVDILPDFIDTVREKAREYGVEALCEFVVGDVNMVVGQYENYDCAILGAVGDILGTPEETLMKLKQVLRPGGYIILEESYLPDGKNAGDILYKNYEYLPYDQWEELLQRLHIRRIDEYTDAGEEIIDENANDMDCIEARAKELIEKYSHKKEMLEGYVQSQNNEVHDIACSLENAIWLLQIQEK